MLVVMMLFVVVVFVVMVMMFLRRVCLNCLDSCWVIKSWFCFVQICFNFMKGIFNCLFLVSFNLFWFNIEITWINIYIVSWIMNHWFCGKCTFNQIFCHLFCILPLLSICIFNPLFSLIFRKGIFNLWRLTQHISNWISPLFRFENFLFCFFDTIVHKLIAIIVFIISIESNWHSSSYDHDQNKGNINKLHFYKYYYNF